MSKEILTFDDIDIEKRKFHYHKYPADVKNDTDKITISKKVFQGFQYFMVTKMIKS